jgi:hypothetical protein
MRINYGSEGYVEISPSKKSMHVSIVVASRQPDNPLELIANTAEIPLDKFIESYKEIVGPIYMQETKSVEGDATIMSNDKSSNKQGS